MNMKRDISGDRDYEAKLAFVEYIMEHPQERFWQSVRNFQHYNFIYASNKIVDDPDVHDTFYWEDLGKKRRPRHRGIRSLQRKELSVE